jgi:hypothetical protein
MRRKINKIITGHNPTKTNNIASSIKSATNGIQRKARNNNITRKRMEKVMLI